MLNTDFHTQSKYSDGESSIREMILAAIKKKFKAIAITDHIPLPFTNNAAMSLQNLDKYRSEVQKLKKEFEEKIEVLMGLEIDYYAKELPWIKDIIVQGWDMVIGSVHFSRHLKENGLPYQVDYHSEFEATLKEAFKGDIRALCKEYYSLVQEMVRLDLFDQIGHIDLVKEFNAENKYFDEGSSWYRNLVMETIDVIKNHSIIVEINTSGFDKPRKEQYPSLWIIKECKKNGIKMRVNSDAHSPSKVGRYFEKMEKLLEGTE
ncbi:MAG TPA: histidinol-phosphatase HisJ [bacterium]|nr:histidinol-phosphatase HisJ [bacterium]